MLSTTATDPLSAFHHTEACTRPTYVYFTGHRGHEMVQCLTCKRSVPLSRLTDAVAHEEAEPEIARWELLCLCGAQIPVTRGEPRVPLCPRCVTSRQQERRERRSSRRSRLEVTEW